MNSSLLAGLGVGTGLVLAGLVGSTLIFPPQPGPGAPAATEIISQADQAPEPAAPEPATPELAELEAVEPESATSELVETEPTAPAPATPELAEIEAAEPAPATPELVETEPTAPAPATPELAEIEAAEPAPATPELAETEAAEPEPTAPEPATPGLAETEAAEQAPPVPQSSGPEPEAESPDLATPDPETLGAPEADTALTDPALQADSPAAPSPLPDVPQDPAIGMDLADDPQPRAPTTEVTGPQARLPSGIMPSATRDPAQALPQVTLPQTPSSDAESAPAADAPAAEDSAALAEQPSATLPGTRRSTLPQIGAGDASAPNAAGDVPAPGSAAVSALERNSLYHGSGNGARMALVLSDPGLPTAMRQSLAALDFPLTVALNPMDTTAAAAAEIYMEAGKEVLILATAIPDGATASDLDVTFNAYFGSLPMAVGVIDLPQTGFARNARLLNEVLPLLQQDGHGLVTFSGGLAQAARSAASAGVPHAEVFRIIDAGNDSAFTMRRFLDRAVFQASQMGQVIVFGDASNDVLMEAITMWRDGSRLDQVALVPISGILRNLP